MTIKDPDDVRPWYDTGSLGDVPATGVVIIGADGLPVDMTNLGGGGEGGDNSAVVAAVEEAKLAIVEAVEGISFTLPVGTNRSALIAAAGVSQELMAANPARKYALITNMTGSPLWVNEAGPAVVGGAPGNASVELPNQSQGKISSQNAVNIACVAAGGNVAAIELV